MKSIFKTTLIGLALLLACATANVAQETKRVKTPRERLAERSFPNVTLTTHEGRKVRFYDDLIKDKIVIINFMYVKCDGKCPATTTNLAKVQKLLGDRVGKDIFIYSITLKPEEDTPKILKAYAKAYKVGPGWQFLTGDPKNIELLRQKLGFIDRDPVRDADKSNHIGMLRWGNEPHTLWAGCPATLAPAKIVKDLRLVDWPTIEEAGRDRAKEETNESKQSNYLRPASDVVCACRVAGADGGHQRGNCVYRRSGTGRHCDGRRQCVRC